MKPTLRIGIALGCLLVVSVAQSQESGQSELQKLRGAFQKSLGALEGELTQFDGSYKAALKRLQESESKAGRLEEAIAAKKELAVFTDSEFHELEFRSRLSSFGKLRNLQNKYLEERAKAEVRIAEPKAALARKYDAELDKLQVALTKAGKLDEALKVTEESRELRSNPKYDMSASRNAMKDGRFWGRARFLGSGDVELYVNGRRVNFKDIASRFKTNNVVGESAAREFAAGDVIFVKIKSAWTNRGCVLSLVAEDESVYVPIRREALHVLDDNADPGKVTEEIVRFGSTESGIAWATEGMKEAWAKVGLPQPKEGGSEWFMPPGRSKWACWATIITPRMILRLPKKE